jgi:hypothetical protein
VVSKRPELKLQVTGQDPLEAGVPMYSNFLAVSRVAGEVQFEFIFLDLNQLALMLTAERVAEKSEAVPQLTGKTVAKIIIPAQNFLQLKDHVVRMFSDIEKELQQGKEVQNARSGTGS